MDYPKAINRCGGIIFNKTCDKVLLVLNKESHRKGEDKWGFPKGHRKKNERIIDCAKREIYEETGLSIPKEIFKKRIFIHNSLYFIIFLKQRYDSFNFKDKKEIEKAEWKNLKQIELLNINRDVRRFMSKNKSKNNFDLCLNNKDIEMNNDCIRTIINNMIVTI